MLTAMWILTGALCGQADVTSPESLQIEVQRLVRQLDADELAQRQAAEQALIELGPAVLDHLPRLNSRTPPEVAQRVKRIREVLEQQAAEAATQASRVTLESQTMPLSRFVAALKQQTDNQLVDFRPRWGQPAGDVEVAVDFERATFWEALDRTLDGAGLTLYNYTGEQHTVAYVVREPGVVPRATRAAYCGVFRIEPTEISAQRDLRRPTVDTLRLTLEIAWEPRLVPIALSQSLADIQAVDEQGNPIPVSGEDGSLESPVRGGVSAVEMEIPLTVPARNVQRIASLKGRLAALLPGRVEAFEFGQLKDVRDEELRKGGVTVVLQTVRKNVAVYEARIIVRFDEAANALESHRGWIYNNKAYLIDAEGKEVEHAGFETTRQTLNEVGMAFKFALDKDLADYRFVYETPAAIVRLPVEYELKDIALP